VNGEQAAPATIGGIEVGVVSEISGTEAGNL